MSLRRLTAPGLLFVLLFAAGGVPFSTSLAFSNLVVNDLSDTLHSPGCATSGTGTCSLRDAITYANANGGEDSITFSVSGTITLGSTLPSINDTLTIDGGGNITLDGAGNYQVLSIFPSQTTTLRNLGITGGSFPGGLGGGIGNDGTLTADNLSITGNNATQGGGIGNDGTLTLTNSTISGNGATTGGGIYSTGGSVTVSGTTISNNSADGNGGGIHTGSSSTVTSSNNTFDNNAAQSSGNGGAMYSKGGAVNSTSDTFTNNQASGYGGAIYSKGSVKVKSGTFSTNTGDKGGAIYVSSGSLVVKQSNFTGNTTGLIGWGGAILTEQSTTTVTNSSFSGNWAEYGGGMFINGGTANVIGSTLTRGTGWGSGGGIYSWAAALTVTNSTLTGNTAELTKGGGIYLDNGNLWAVNSTIAKNKAGGGGGGVYVYGGAIALFNTIVSNNLDLGGENCFSLGGGSISADSHNLDSDGSCDGATQKTVSEIALGSLKQNGGPTQTMALGAGSAALNAGYEPTCTAPVGSPLYGAGGEDQRGNSRPQGQPCDSGAFESDVQVGPGFIVNDAADTDDGECSWLIPGFSGCTLREALNAANARSGSDKITFSIPASTPGCTEANHCTITLTSALTAITGKVTIDGSANNGIIQLSGANDSAILAVNSGNLLNLNALTLLNGVCECANGGGVLNQGTLNVTNSTFSTHASGGDGSGITNYGTATVTNSTFSGDSGTENPYSAIYNSDGGTMYVVNSTLARNNGYGIDAAGGTMTLRNSIVAANVHGDCNVQGGTLNASKYNQDTDGSCASATTQTVAELQLGPLQENGGPVPATQTIKPGANSSARDAGKDPVCTDPVGPPDYGAGGLDQRGVKRPQGPHCDVGAFEVRVN